MLMTPVSRSKVIYFLQNAYVGTYVVEWTTSPGFFFCKLSQEHDMNSSYILKPYIHYRKSPLVSYDGTELSVLCFFKNSKIRTAV
jgi:hypothetical protein